MDGVVARLAGEFPGWHIWRSDRAWWATRRTRRSDAQFDAGMYATLCGDTADQLRTELIMRRAAEDRAAGRLVLG